MGTQQQNDETIVDDQGADNPLVSGRRQSKLPPELEARVEERRIEGQIMGAIASQTWGMRISPVMRRAVAQYCIRYGLDPLTELDLLGGNPYPNSEFYLRKLGELRTAGVIREYRLRHINADPALLETAKDETVPKEVREWALREHWSRWQRRRELNANDDATAVCVCEIILVNAGAPIVGWKQAGGGTAVKQNRSGGSSAPNPIVEEENNAALAVESQAIRRAVRQIASHVNLPTGVAAARELVALSSIDADTDALAERVEATRAPEPPPAPEPRQLVEASYNEADALLDRLAQKKRDTEGRPVPVTHVVEGGAPNATLRKAFDAADDPYRDPPAESAPIATDVAPGTNPDMFTGAETPLERPVTQCPECKKLVRNPEDHDPDCSRYGDPD